MGLTLNNNLPITILKLGTICQVYFKFYNFVTTIEKAPSHGLYRPLTQSFYEKVESFLVTSFFLD